MSQSMHRFNSITDVGVLTLDETVLTIDGATLRLNDVPSFSNNPEINGSGTLALTGNFAATLDGVVVSDINHLGWLYDNLECE